MQTLHISAIFERKEDGKYTNDALLYQHILKYPIYGEERFTDSNKAGSMETQVRLWDMIKWLIRTLPEFRTKYLNDDVRITIPKIRRRIKRKLDDLVYLELLQSEKQKQKTSDGTTDSYRYTVHGRLLGWIIESIDFANGIVSPNHNDELIIDIQIFKSLQRIFKTGQDAQTINILVSNFMSKCLQQRLFGNIVNLLKNALNDQEIPIENMSDLLYNLTTCNFREPNTKVIFSRLWDETIMELEPEVRNMVLYDAKLTLERDMEEHVKAYQLYEKWWFRFKGDYDRVVVECFCTNCKKYTSAAMNIMEYRQRKLYSTIDLSKLAPLCLIYYTSRLYTDDRPNELSETCPACGKHDSLRLPFLA